MEHWVSANPDGLGVPPSQTPSHNQSATVSLSIGYNNTPHASHISASSTTERTGHLQQQQQQQSSHSLLRNHGLPPTATMLPPPPPPRVIDLDEYLPVIVWDLGWHGVGWDPYRRCVWSCGQGSQCFYALQRNTRFCVRAYSATAIRKFTVPPGGQVVRYATSGPTSESTSRSTSGTSGDRAPRKRKREGGDAVAPDPAARERMDCASLSCPAARSGHVV